MSDLRDFLNSYVLRHVGLGLECIKDLSVEEVDQKISLKVGKKIEVSPPDDDRLLGRGSVLLHRLSRIEDVDRELSRI